VPERRVVRMTTGSCPYCGEASSNDVVIARAHPTQTVRRCVRCDLHSTEANGGKRYPHDDPTDPASPMGLSVTLSM